MHSAQNLNSHWFTSFILRNLCPIVSERTKDSCSQTSSNVDFKNGCGKWETCIPVNSGHGIRQIVRIRDRPYFRFHHLPIFDFITFRFEKCLFIISRSFIQIWETKSGGNVFNTALSRGSLFLKKKSRFTGAVRKKSSLKYTKCSASPEILCIISSIGLAEKTGRYSCGM